MAQEVGVAYVTLLPSGRGFGKAVEGQVDGALKSSEKSTTGFFSKVGTGIKRVGLGVVGVATGVAALAAGGGISRALNIEDAQAKLKGLGHDTKSVEKIMEDALASVKGTAFGLDAAATTAAAAVASGIEPGRELEGYLRLTADAATIAGVSMEEMGSIMNKVQAKGKAQMEDLNRLTERGIPIMQMLAEEYGVTAEEMSKMVSKGEVDSERFRKALEKNLGGAALESGDTTRGAFKNMMAALSRLGLVFVEDGVAGAKTFFNEVTVILDGLAERFRPWVDRVRAAFGDAFNPAGFGEKFLAGFDRLVSALNSGPVSQVLSALQPVLPAVLELAQAVGGALGDALREVGQALAPALPGVIEALANAVVELAPSLADLLAEIVPLIPSLTELLAAVTPLAVDLLELLVPAIGWLIDIVAKAAEPLAAFFDMLSGGSSFEQFMANLDQIADAPGTGLRVMLDYIEVVQERWAEMMGFFTGVKDFFVATFTTIGDFFRTTWEAIGLTLGGALKTIWGLLTGNMDLIREGVQQGLSAIRNWWNSVWGGISSTFAGVWSSLSSTVANGVSNVVSFLQTLPGRVQAAVAALPLLLVSVGRDMIQGLINGVSSMINAAVEAVRNVGGSMLSAVKSFLGIKSPSRVFRDEVGKMVGLGLLAGIEDQSIRGRIDSSISHMVSVPEGLAGASSGWPSRMVLVDADGSILTRAKVIADSAIDAFAGQAVSVRRSAEAGGVYV